jgi:hypothetical protein
MGYIKTENEELCVASGDTKLAIGRARSSQRRLFTSRSRQGLGGIRTAASVIESI